MAPKFGLDDGSNSDFDVTLVLATMLVSQLQEGRPFEPPPAGASADQGRGSQVQPDRSRPVVSDHPSDHTRIWSELSGNFPCSVDGSLLFYCYIFQTLQFSLL